MKNTLFIFIFYITFSGINYMNPAYAAPLKVATFNVSMEALNYVPYKRGELPNVSSGTLKNALETNHQQIRNIAEIIQRVNPDIILLNEFDNQDNTPHNKSRTLKLFIDRYLMVSQKGQKPIQFPYFYQGSINTGVNSGFDLDGNGKKGVLPGDGYGYGHFAGHFGMALLSKYPIKSEQIRTFQYFKWKDMPNALQPIDPTTKKPWFSDEAWQNLRLSSKSHWDIPVVIKNKTLHILASHPTPPVFDGPEDRNGKRNHDEIRFWNDYISPQKSAYIYDDKGNKGGLGTHNRFVILGDLNASNTDGDAVKDGISSLIDNPLIQDPLPSSLGGKENAPKNEHALHHTAFWRMRADYVLPSAIGLKIQDSGVFWPTKSGKLYRLIKDRSASSDHRLVWIELDIVE
jgi:hypothetical protein